MEKLLQVSIAAFVVAVCLLCAAGVLNAEQATAQNVKSIIVSLHQGGN